MKKFIFLFFLLPFLNVSESSAQKFAYVDTEYILEQIPEYRAAQQKLNDLAREWQSEIEVKKQEIDKLFRNFRAEQVLLSDAIRKEREDEIIKKEKALNDFKRQKFGPGGELEKKRQELLKPIQDKVFEAIQDLAKDNALDFVFDKSGSVTMLFTNAKFDRSDEVLDYMGIVPGTGGDNEEE